MKIFVAWAKATGHGTHFFHCATVSILVDGKSYTSLVGSDEDAKRRAHEVARELAPPGYPELVPGCDVYSINTEDHP